MKLTDGLLLIDKEPGCTSHDVVQQARRILRQKRIGHCGTLDPDATGLLLLTLGRATRLTRFLIRAPKVYAGHLRFGIATDTYDGAGRVVSQGSTEGLTTAAVSMAMRAFEGTREQATPPYSARKIAGARYYELARRGEEVPVASKEITVFEFGPAGELDQDRLPFRLSCSSGTYARSLAQDLGQQLGCGAHLAELRRLQIGPFKVDDAVPLGELKRRTVEADADQDTAEALAASWVPFDLIPLPFGELTADTQQERRITHGQSVLVRGLPGEEGDWIKLVNRRRQFIAVGSVVERFGEAGLGVVQPRIVFK